VDNFNRLGGPEGYDTRQEEQIMEKDLLWKNVLGQLRLNVSEGTFTTFLKPLVLGEIKKIDEGRQLAEICCPNAFIRDTAEQRFWGQIKTTMDEICEIKTELLFSVKAVLAREDLVLEKNGEGLGGTLFDSGRAEKDFSGRLRKAGLGEAFTFDAFAVSGSNQMAHAAAFAVSNKPGTAYNPLFVWGGVGVGKTHLMHAIGIKLITKNVDIRIIYCSGEEFTNDIVEGIKTKSMDRVRGKYRKLQLLLLDDIQFIAGKEAVQEEFFHTFNDIQRQGGQVVMTSDRPPAEIARLEDRLRSRFEAGLTVDISPPDFALRSAITLIKAEQKGLSISNEIAQTIAQHADSARKIEGVLTKLITIVGLEGGSVNEESVRRALDIKEENGERRIFTPGAVLDLVAEKYGVSVGQIKGSRRNRPLVVPRMLAMYILRADLKFPFEEIGRIIGGRDHSTVMHAVGKIESNLEQDVSLRHSVGEIRKKLFGEKSVN